MPPITTDETEITKSTDDLNNYQIRPNLSDAFKVAAVKEIIIQVMHETLEGNHKFS